MITKHLIAIIFLMNMMLLACQPSDKALKAAVNEKLSMIPGISADVKNGVVTLSGEVSDEVAKSAAEDALKGMKGVKSIQDSIRIKVVMPLTPPVVHTPEELLKKALDSVYSVNGFNDITVVVTKDEIVLNGTAKRKQLNKAVQLAQRLANRKVTNEIKITK